MTIKKLHAQGVPNTEIARMLGVTEGSIRYHVRRQAQSAVDGRSGQRSCVADLHEAIVLWLESQESGMNVAALHDHLVEEHAFAGSRRAVQRYVARSFPQPRIRARRRVETPPGAQGQVDWAEFRGVWLAGQLTTLYALHVQLSHSRYGAIVWSRHKDQLSWQSAHNDALRRLGGVPATLRIDNEKTAVVRGAGSWGEINSSYRRYAQAARFHIDACQPRSPEHKGKVERRIRDHRFGMDPRGRHWNDLAELQEWTDRKYQARAARRRCPATGRSVLESWVEERARLQPLPILPEPFDVIVRRPVGIDCMVHFESRQYSVPFRLVGRHVEVRGCAGLVQILSEQEVVAEHPRGTQSLIVIDVSHFEGPATDRVLPPLPLGKMGRRLQEIAAMAPQSRPIDMYASLAEVAR